MTEIGDLVGWIPVCPLDGHATLGALDGHLTIDLGHEQRPVGADDLVGLLPLLEQPFLEFLGVLDQREVELHLDPGSLRRWVPWPAVVRLASMSSSAYWAELALWWVEAMPVEDRDERAVLELATNRLFPQSLRHRALRVLRSTGRPGQRER